MTSREVLIAICAGLASAAAATAFLSKTFMAVGFVYLASLPMLMVGLACGLPAAIVAAIVLTMRRRPDTRYQMPSEQVKVNKSDRLRIVSMPAETRSETKK